MIVRRLRLLYVEPENGRRNLCSENTRLLKWYLWVHANFTLIVSQSEWSLRGDPKVSPAHPVPLPVKRLCSHLANNYSDALGHHDSITRMSQVCTTSTSLYVTTQLPHVQQKYIPFSCYLYEPQRRCKTHLKMQLLLCMTLHESNKPKTRSTRTGGCD